MSNEHRRIRRGIEREPENGWGARPPRNSCRRREMRAWPGAEWTWILQRASSAAALLVVALIGCRSAKTEPASPLPPPAGVAALVSHYAGAPMSPAGATTGTPADLDYTEPLDVRVEWVLLERMPRDLPPLLTRARLILAPREADPFRATGRLTRTAGFVPPENVEAFLTDATAAKFGRRTTIADGADPSVMLTALPRGATAAFALAPSDPGDPDNATATPGVQLDVHRTAAALTTAPASGPAGESLELALVVTGPDRAESGQTSLQRERVLLAPMTVTVPLRFAVVVPSQFISEPASSQHALAAIVTVAAGEASPEFEQAIARCKTDLGGGGSMVAVKSSREPQIGSAAGHEAVVRRLNHPTTARPALAYLATETGADLSSDVSLAADDATVAEIGRRIDNRVKEQPDDVRERAKLGWMLDSACLEQLAAMRTAEQLPPELAGVLSVHAGEAGRRSSSLDELARAGSHDAFAARVVAENLSYLEDASPSARVRAYDWLRLRGRAPAGYEPLGPIKDRRKSLDAAVADVNPDPPAVPAAAAVPGGSK